MEYNVILIPFG